MSEGVRGRARAALATTPRCQNQIEEMTNRGRLALERQWWERESALHGQVGTWRRTQSSTETAATRSAAHAAGTRGSVRAKTQREAHGQQRLLRTE